VLLLALQELDALLKLFNFIYFLLFDGLEFYFASLFSLLVRIGFVFFAYPRGFLSEVVIRLDFRKTGLHR
jgi:hypothetical protein